MPSVIIGGLAGKEKKDNSIRIPFSTSTVSTVGRGWLGAAGLLPAIIVPGSLSAGLNADNRAQRERGGRTVNTRPWSFKNLVSFPLICVLYPSPLCCISFSKLMPITPPPTGNSRLLGHCGVLIAAIYNACHHAATVLLAWGLRVALTPAPLVSLYSGGQCRSAKLLTPTARLGDHASHLQPGRAGSPC